MPRPTQTGEGYCIECKQAVKFHYEDCGIGAYEYWGARGTHHDYQPFCDECGGEIEPRSITPDDREPEWEPDLEDHREDR